jgi:transcriptional regulator with XRE-family HTH domain
MFMTASMGRRATRAITSPRKRHESPFGYAPGVSKTERRLYPALLRHWRTRRGFSQLDLAVAADVSSRHVSFLETGRAQPSREMALRLAATLSVPLRDQNDMLRAAGFADEFGEPNLEGGLSEGVSRAIDRMMAQHEPYPMTVLDRRYDVKRTNQGAARLLMRFVAEPSALPATLNVFALLFDPRLARPFLVDWERVAHALVARLHRQTLERPTDAGLGALLRSLFEYPDVPERWRQPDFSVPNEPVLTLRLKRDALAVSFLTTLTVFNAPQDVTLEELCIESYFPLDDATAATCVELAR